MMKALLLTALTFLAATSVPGDRTMNPKIIDKDAFTVIGISARTSNRKEVTADGVIAPMWQRFFQESLLTKIAHKADQNIVAIYTDYASDQHGEYTYVLGVRVTSEAEIPPGMVVKRIPAQKFAVFTSERGPAAEVVPQLWMKINALPKTAAGGDRLYKADFEIYDERASDPENLQMDAYVGIK